MRARSRKKLKNMTVLQLREQCKKKGIEGCSKMKKDKLIETIKPTVAGYNRKKIVIKKRTCGIAKVRGRQRENARRTRLENMTVIELKALCKKKEIKGCSKMRKDELVKEIIKKEKKIKSKKEKERKKKALDN
jgi:transcription termination factor Rho